MPILDDWTELCTVDNIMNYCDCQPWLAAECGEFSGRGAALEKSAGQHSSGATNMGDGPTIIYMPTRKETEAVAKFLCSHGVVAAAYHAKVILPGGGTSSCAYCLVYDLSYSITISLKRVGTN